MTLLIFALLGSAVGTLLGAAGIWLTFVRPALSSDVLFRYVNCFVFAVNFVNTCGAAASLITGRTP